MISPEVAVQREKVSQGFIEVEGGRVWYKSYGLPSETPPILTLHGGPGFPHPDLYPLVDLYMKHNIPVILYDQLGAGHSDKPKDQKLWNIDRFVNEVETVHKYLKDKFSFSGIHLLGHSWGSTLATEYYLQKRPDDVKSLILTSPFLSGEIFKNDVARLVDQIHPGISAALPKPKTEAYDELEAEFNNRHVCRIVPNPRDMNVTYKMRNEDVYDAMQGPSEFDMSGNLAEYDARDRLGSIDIPVLYTAGRYDETTPESTNLFRTLTPNSEFVIFEKSAHMAQFEERETYMLVMKDFVNKVNNTTPSTAS